MQKKWLIIWIILFVLMGYFSYLGKRDIVVSLVGFLIIQQLYVQIKAKYQWWRKKKQAIKQKKSFTELQKSDSQAKVVGIIGKPDTIENRETGKEIWTYNYGSEEKRIVTFQDGFIEKIEVKF